MRKVLVGLVAVIAAIGVLAGGCTLSPETIPIVAQQAGLYSAVGWIALDNPTSNEVSAVKSVLEVIEEKAADVQGGGTYTAIVYPEVVKFIDKDLQEQYRPIARAGALSILGGIDMLFATHPEWKEDQDLVVKILDAFILGAKAGLGMSASDPIMLQAMANAEIREKEFTAEARKARDARNSK